MKKRVALVMLLALVALLAMATAAYAATSQDIFNDFAANGKLTGTYTNAELQAYLNDAPLHHYKPPKIVAALDVVVKGLLAAKEEKGTAKEEKGTFPFTGFEMAIALLGGAALLGGGVLIRKWAR